jgi:hypothetical protein
MSINSDDESSNQEQNLYNNIRKNSNSSNNNNSTNKIKSSIKADGEFQFSSYSTASTTSASSSSPTPSSNSSSNTHNISNDITRISTKYVSNSDKKYPTSDKPSRALFHHVLIVGINRIILNKSQSIDNLNANEYETRQSNANGPYVLWTFPKDLVSFFLI